MIYQQQTAAADAPAMKAEADAPAHGSLSSSYFCAAVAETAEAGAAAAVAEMTAAASSGFCCFCAAAAAERASDSAASANSSPRFAGTGGCQDIVPGTPFLCGRGRKNQKDAQSKTSISGVPCAPYKFPFSAWSFRTKNYPAAISLFTLFPVFTLLTLKIDFINRRVVLDEFRPFRLAHTFLRIPFYFYTMNPAGKGIR